MIDLGLLDVADVAYPQGSLPDGEVECNELTHGRLVVERGEANVLAPVFRNGHLVIRLSVFGREHYPQQRDIQLIAQ